MISRHDNSHPMHCKGVGEAPPNALRASSFSLLRLTRPCRKNKLCLIEPAFRTMEVSR